MHTLVVGCGTMTKRGTAEKEEKEVKRKGIQEYKYLQPILEPCHNGKLILIDTETRGYIIGEDKKETYDLAQAKFGSHGVFWCRVGEGSLHFEEE